MDKQDTELSVGTRKKLGRFVKCLVSILKFWRMCTKKPKQPGAL